MARSFPPTLTAAAVAGAPLSTSSDDPPGSHVDEPHDRRRLCPLRRRTARRPAARSPRSRRRGRASRPGPAAPSLRRRAGGARPSPSGARRRSWRSMRPSPARPVARETLAPFPATTTLPSSTAITTLPSTPAADSSGAPTRTTPRRRDVVSACRRTSSAVGVGDATAESRASRSPSSGSVGSNDTAAASSSRAWASRASARALLRCTRAKTATRLVTTSAAIAAAAITRSRRFRRCASTSSCAWTWRPRQARIGAARTSW